jgi:hypothetical protein
MFHFNIEICGSQGGEDDDDVLLGFDAISYVETNISGLKMEAVCFSEILVSTYKSTHTQCQNPEQQQCQFNTVLPSASVTKYVNTENKTGRNSLFNTGKQQN